MFKISRMFSDVLRTLSMLSQIFFRHSQMSSRCFQMFRDVFRCSEMFTDVHRFSRDVVWVFSGCSQNFSIMFSELFHNVVRMFSRCSHDGPGKKLPCIEDHSL